MSLISTLHTRLTCRVDYCVCMFFLNVIRWVRPIRMRIWCRNNPEKKLRLATFMYVARAKSKIKRRKTATKVLLVSLGRYI